MPSTSGLHFQMVLVCRDVVRGPQPVVADASLAPLRGAEHRTRLVNVVRDVTDGGLPTVGWCQASGACMADSANNQSPFVGRAAGKGRSSEATWAVLATAGDAKVSSRRFLGLRPYFHSVSFASTSFPANQLPKTRAGPLPSSAIQRFPGHSPRLSFSLSQSST